MCSFYENNPKAFFFFLTSSLLIKLSCQEHINNRRHNSLHRGREKKSRIGEKRNDFSFCRVKRQCTMGTTKLGQRFLPLSMSSFLSHYQYDYGVSHELRCRVSIV